MDNEKTVPKPCPFGNTHSLKLGQTKSNSESSPPLWVIGCNDCRFNFVGTTREEVIERWNTRFDVRPAIAEQSIMGEVSALMQHFYEVGNNQPADVLERAIVFMSDQQHSLHGLTQALMEAKAAHEQEIAKQKVYVQAVRDVTKHETFERISRRYKMLLPKGMN